MTEEVTWGDFMAAWKLAQESITPEEENETWARVAAWLDTVDPGWSERMDRIIKAENKEE